MTKYFACEGSPRTSAMIERLHDCGFGLVAIRKAIGIDMEGWKDFKSKRLTDWDAYDMGYGEEYGRLVRSSEALTLEVLEENE